MMSQSIMNQQMRSRLLAAVLLMFAVGSTEGYSYIHPSLFLVQKIATRGSGLETMRLQSRVTLYQEDRPTGVYFNEDLFFDHRLHRLVSRAFNDRGVLIKEVERRLWDSSSQALTSRSVSGSLASYVLFEKDVDAIVSALKEAQIPVVTEAEMLAQKDEKARWSLEHSTLKRWGNLTSIVLGLASGGPTTWTPQLWLDKDNYSPLRLIWNSEAKGATWSELQFNSPRYNGGFQYPGQIFALENARLILSVELKEYQANVKETSSKSAGGAAKLESTSADLSELLRLFYAHVR